MAKETIAEMLKAISVMYDKQFTKLVLDSAVLPNITSTQMSILQYMAQHEQDIINQRDLQEAFNLSKSTVSGIVQRLQQHGFIDVIPMPNDKRYKQLVFNQHFRREMQQHEADFDEQLDVMAKRLVAGMSADEVATYQHLLNVSLHNLTDNDG